MDPKYFCSETCKQMLLYPRSPFESYNRNLKLNIDDTEPTKFYACQTTICLGKDGLLVSAFKNIKCECGMNMTIELTPDESLMFCPGVRGCAKLQDVTREGYVRETASFIIFDDLNVVPADMNTSLCLLKNLRTNDTSEEFTVVLSPNEIVDLLKCSLISKTALTDSLFTKEHKLENSITTFKVTERQGKESEPMKLKLLIAKSKCKILFAQVEEEFVDQLLCFLTFPLGAVEGVLEGNSGLGCVDKLYNSWINFDSTRDLKSENMKSVFANLEVAPLFKAKKQMLSIDELKYPSELYICCPNGRLPSVIYLTTDESLSCVWGRFVRMYDPKSPTDNKAWNGYAKSRTMFMVADDLSVKPFSSHLVVTSLIKSKVRDHDLEEGTICIGVKEVLSILRASVISSTSALTDGLNEFLTNTINEEM